MEFLKLLTSIKAIQGDGRGARKGGDCALVTGEEELEVEVEPERQQVLASAPALGPVTRASPAMPAPPPEPETVPKLKADRAIVEPTLVPVPVEISEEAPAPSIVPPPEIP